MKLSSAAGTILSSRVVVSPTLDMYAGRDKRQQCTDKVDVNVMIMEGFIT